MPRIESIKQIETGETYDLEVDHDSHQFFLENGLLTSNSHAVAYAITSWQCAWFLTYYADEWIESYLDFATTSKGKSASGEDPKVVALAEALLLGYKIGQADINLSGETYQVRKLEKSKEIIPSFAGVKWVGTSALREIEQHRPYQTVYDLLINPDGTWRHSKFNKRALGNLIKVGAFNSMGLVGPEKPFRSNKEFHDIVIGNFDLLKRVSARKKNNDVKAALDDLIAKKKETEVVTDWSIEEKLEFSLAITGSLDFNLLIPAEALKFFAKKSIDSIDEFDPTAKRKEYWAVVKDMKEAISKNGKPYAKLTLFGSSGKTKTCMIWNYTEGKLKKFDLILAPFTARDSLLQTFPDSIKKLKRAIQ